MRDAGNLSIVEESEKKRNMRQSADTHDVEVRLFAEYAAKSLVTPQPSW
jgi:hypothetical protein